MRQLIESLYSPTMTMDALEELLADFDRDSAAPNEAPNDVRARDDARVRDDAPNDARLDVPLDRRARRDAIYRLLYSYQVPHVDHLVGVLERRSTAIDGSETGTGKMYCECAVAAIMGLSLFVCCPKSVIPTYFEVAARFEVDLLGVSNYEALMSGKYYPTIESFMNSSRQECPYYCEANSLAIGTRWNLPNDTLVVFDEAHKCRRNTATANFMTSIVPFVGTGERPRSLLASATIADSVPTFRNTAYILGLAQQDKHAFAAWIRRITAGAGRDVTDEVLIDSFHRAMYPLCGARMSINAIKARLDDDARLFAHNDSASMICQMSPDEEAGIMNAYGEIAEAIDALKMRQRGELHPLTVILRARQRIEMLKMPTFGMVAMEWLLQGRRVAIFVNFDATADTIFEIADKFVQSEWPGSPVAIIRGGQTPADRRWNIDAFQSDRARVIVCNIRAGGVGISLHGRNRASIISMPWSAIDYEQAKGRIYRAGGGDVIQRTIYCSGGASPAGPEGALNDTTFEDKGQRIGVEEWMARTLNKKLSAVHMLNGAEPPARV